MEKTALIVWAVLVVAFLVIEAASVQLMSIWFAVGALGALIANFCGANIAVQVVIFILVSILCLVLTRPFVKKFVKVRQVKTNADRLIGQEALVTDDINNIQQTGLVKISGSVWTARSSENEEIPAGTIVEVEKIEGVKMFVHKK